MVNNAEKQKMRISAKKRLESHYFHMKITLDDEKGKDKISCVNPTPLSATDKGRLSNEEFERMVNNAEKQKAVVLSRDTSEAVSNLLLLDVLPLFIETESAGGVVTALIRRNKTNPNKQTQTFTTYRNNRNLGKFDFTGIPPASADVPQTKVTFNISATDTNDHQRQGQAEERGVRATGQRRREAEGEDLCHEQTSVSILQHEDYPGRREGKGQDLPGQTDTLVHHPVRKLLQGCL